MECKGIKAIPQETGRRQRVEKRDSRDLVGVEVARNQERIILVTIQSRALPRTRRGTVAHDKERIIRVIRQREEKSQPLGDLARRVFVSLSSGHEAGDLRRLVEDCQTWGIDVPEQPERTSWPAQLNLVRQLLQRWAAKGQASWREDSSLIDPYDGPTDVLSTAVGSELLDQIQWVPANRQARFFRTESPVAAVLISAAEGIYTGRLRICIGCRQLMQPRFGQGRKKRCSNCASDRQVRLNQSGLQRTYRLVKDRLRHWKDYAETKRRLRERMDATIREAREGKQSVKQAQATMEALVPKRRRGRRPRIQAGADPAVGRS